MTALQPFWDRDTSGNIVTVYGYDPQGRTSKLFGNVAADLQYAGYYQHAASGLSLTNYRAYSSAVGRWLTRDPLNNRLDANSYRYAENDPIDLTDPLGLMPPINLGVIFEPGINNLRDPGFVLSIILTAAAGAAPVAVTNRL